MDPRQLWANASKNAATFRAAGRSHNLKVMTSLAGPALRGLVLQKGKAGAHGEIESANRLRFNWHYHRTGGELERLYAAAKRSQWDAASLDWSIRVDPYDETRELMQDEALYLRALAPYRRLSKREQQWHRHQLLAWMLSQFLHGEQGALLAACQVTEAMGFLDGKLYGATQVADEGRHVEAFHRYLHEKLEKLYPIDDNLYMILDALLTDARWDIKFLGMQILIEGLALGAFSTIRAHTREPLLRELLRNVITDEARHVHFGIVALRDYYGRELSEPERREREDWAYEICLLLRNRFLAHEFYEEHYAASLSRAEWDRGVLGSDFMRFFQSTLFRRVIPSLKRIHLLSDRIRPHYRALGVLAFEDQADASQLAPEQLLEGS